MKGREGRDEGKSPGLAPGLDQAGIGDRESSTWGGSSGQRKDEMSLLQR